MTHFTVSASERVRKWLVAGMDGSWHHILSPNRDFAHAPSRYDSQYRIQPDDLSHGNGLLRLLDSRKIKPLAPAWEIGCGTGVLSVGLAAGHSFPLLLLTDMSSEFLALTRKKCDALKIDPGRYRLAVYDSENAYSPPPQKSFSLIVLRAALHHFLHPDKFIQAAADWLVPGGALIFQEPCRDAFLLMGCLASAHAQQLGNNRRGPWRLFRWKSKHFQKMAELVVKTVTVYSRSDIDKTDMEDKHLFTPGSIIKTGRRCGLDFEFIANADFNSFEKEKDVIPDRDFFRRFTGSYLKNCMSLPDEYVRSFQVCVEPMMRYIEESFSGLEFPPYYGIFIGKKRIGEE